MKNIFSKSLLILSFFVLFSCTNNSGTQIPVIYEESLKDISDKRNAELNWTKEIESVRLIRDINKSSSVISTVKLSPEIMAVSVQENPPVYPFLEDFGSLDTTNLSNELREFLDSFCSKICTWEFDDSLMDSNYVFSLILFKYDVEQLYNNSKIQFSDYIYGEPFIDKDVITAPVRFSTNDVTLDISVYVDKSSSFKINQIVIDNFVVE